jgi:hypothetical protein
VNYSTSKWSYMCKIKNRVCHWCKFWSSHIQIYIF